MTVTLSARPSDDPVWATDEVNNTEPITAKKELGWEVDEEPASSSFNWWQKNVYDWQQWLEGAIDALNAGKADLDGDTFTGAVVFDDDITVNQNATFAGINSIGSSTWFGDFVPEVDLTYDLGTSAARFSEVHSNRVLGYTADETPGSNAAVVTLNQRKTTLVCCKQTSATSTASVSTKHFNVSGIVRNSAGNYTVTFDAPIDDDASIIVNPAFTSFAAARSAWARVETGGSTATVFTFLEDGAGVSQPSDMPFTLVVIGSPDADI